MRKTTQIFAIFGTASEMAEKLGKARNTVYQWDKDQFIPRKNWREIIKAAKEAYGYELSFTDFDEHPLESAEA